MGDQPIAWSALEQGTPVEASDGQEIGKVTDVVADEQKDIFSGIVIRTGWFESDVFVPANVVGELTEGVVRLTISASEAEALEPHES